MEPAPLYENAAGGPAGGQAVWLRTTDGLRIRAGIWRGGDKGTVLLFPGRTEYIEKYGPAAIDLGDRGFSVVAIDWRGQGLADRPGKHQLIGHIHWFQDYQKDVDAVVKLARAEGLPEPFFLMSHSMGGCIGLRALHNGLPVRAAVFSAPMWGLAMPIHLRPLAWMVTTLARHGGLGGNFALTQGPDSYVLTAPFEGNTLTSDPEMFAFMKRQLQAHPEFALGGPSQRWLNEALHEMRRLRALPAPSLPAQTWLGTNERIVCPQSIRKVMAKWKNGELRIVEGAEHEIPMEIPSTRKDFFDAAAALFESHSA